MDLKEKVKLGRVYECKSERGNRYFRGRLGSAKVLMFRDEYSDSDNACWDIFVQNGDDNLEAEATAILKSPKRKKRKPASKPKTAKPPAGPLPFNDPLPI
jgi:hypothetical protein